MSAMSRVIGADRGTCALCGRELSGDLLAHSELHANYEAGYWLKCPGCQARGERQYAIDRLCDAIHRARENGVDVKCSVDGEPL